ncbi:RagB/SusD family nutrient uptake outer membrane protein [Marinilabiliaceae bacterium JC017]|nr:RagB/SusD family nutrient uptake outer membrane protein [Marinilabiliaceae bacterium JC017]
MIKMKYILILLMLVGVFACSDDFLEREPTNSTTDEVLLNSAEGCELALHGIYGKTMYAYYQYYVPYFNEARADNLTFTQLGSVVFTNVFNYNQGLASNTVGYQIWAGGYSIIDAANFIIANELIGITDENQRNDYIAQARTMRALIYLDLLNAFSKPVHMNAGENLGVPKITHNDYGYYPTRASVIEIYNLIFEDLDFAIKNLDERMDPEHANRALAHGLLTRMYMNLAGPVGSNITYQFPANSTTTASAALEKAVEHANAVLAIVEPVDNFDDLQNGVSRVLSESILVAKSLSSDKNFEPKETYCAQWDSNNEASKTVRVYTEVVDMFPDNDLRLKYFYDYTTWIEDYEDYTNEGYDHVEASALELDKNGNFVSLDGHRIFGKFTPSDYYVDDLDALLENGVGNIEYTNGLGDFNIMRASEIALLKAEACKRLNKQVEAVKAYELVNNRYVEGDKDNSNLTMDDILLEKRLEFIGEGIRMRDLLRYGKDFSRPPSTLSTVQNVNIEDNHMQLPISDREMKVNENLVQNPGYGK